MGDSVDIFGLRVQGAKPQIPGSRGACKNQNETSTKPNPAENSRPRAMQAFKDLDIKILRRAPAVRGATSSLPTPGASEQVGFKGDKQTTGYLGSHPIDHVLVLNSWSLAGFPIEILSGPNPRYTRVPGNRIK